MAGRPQTQHRVIPWSFTDSHVMQSLLLPFPLCACLQFLQHEDEGCMKASLSCWLPCLPVFSSTLESRGHKQAIQMPARHTMVLLLVARSLVYTFPCYHFTLPPNRPAQLSGRCCPIWLKSYAAALHDLLQVVKWECPGYGNVQPRKCPGFYFPVKGVWVDACVWLLGPAKLRSVGWCCH